MKNFVCFITICLISCVFSVPCVAQAALSNANPITKVEFNLSDKAMVTVNEVKKLAVEIALDDAKNGHLGILEQCYSELKEKIQTHNWADFMNAFIVGDLEYIQNQLYEFFQQIIQPTLNSERALLDSMFLYRVLMDDKNFMSNALSQYSTIVGGITMKIQIKTEELKPKRTEEGAKVFVGQILIPAYLELVDDIFSVTQAMLYPNTSSISCMDDLMFKPCEHSIQSDPTSPPL